ncbi:hypothetical protein IAT40_004638 [Kwoniella sp. CBS 6097]
MPVVQTLSSVGVATPSIARLVEKQDPSSRSDSSSDSSTWASSLTLSSSSPDVAEDPVGPETSGSQNVNDDIEDWENIDFDEWSPPEEDRRWEMGHGRINAACMSGATKTMIRERKERLEADRNAAKLERELTCPICISIYVAPFRIRDCGHTLCWACITQWMQDETISGRAVKCPLCRGVIESEESLQLDREKVEQIQKWVIDALRKEEWDGYADYQERLQLWKLSCGKKRKKKKVTDEDVANKTIAPNEVDHPPQTATERP